MRLQSLFTCQMHPLLLVAALTFSSAACSTATDVVDDSPAGEPEHAAPSPDEIGADASSNPSSICNADASLPCDPVLWMACHPRQEIASRYCESCAGEPTCPTEDARLESQLTSRERLAGFACEEYGYAINAILALHGHPLEDASWQGYLAAQAWQAQRSPAPLPPAAQANLRELRAELETCQNAEPTTADDRAIVAQWFRTFENTGVPPSSALYDVDFAPTSADTFASIADQFLSEGNIEFTRRTPVKTQAEGGTLTLRPPDDGSAAPEALPYARRITVSPHLSAKMSCAEPERCEGYARLTLYLAANGELLAQGITASE
ncbi:hypothetical protein FRC96_11470 [Lujinxingia vulgaris]|uniref:YARHG domain-containing protein n=1 Tax=Lujinxingia vulgaris TaxID=2600176 RepID=A0A5C6X4Y2_9DELT|nr:hypothetical protein [Lujinxingia vulgaris]TXD35287.1 hypothetical protein FRC96_11470 [Lujinxingia vulgaris]